MYFLQSLGKNAESLNSKAKEIVQTICAQIPTLKSKIKIPTRQDVFDSEDRKGKLFLLRDGTLSYTLGDNVIFYYDAGDLIGVEQFLIDTSAKVLSDFAVVVDTFDASQFLDAIYSDKALSKLWSEFLAINQSLMAMLASNLFKGEISAPPDINAFQAGQIIVEEGVRAEGVHLLIEGLAEVSSQGQLIGEIETGDLFGVISTLSGIPWGSTIKATEPCMIMTLPKENFHHLVETRPSAYLRQIEDMAKLLVDFGDRELKVRISNY